MLKVKEIFPTIQGEGPYAGHPAVFVRLSDCLLKCYWCDTDFKGGEEMAERDVVDKIESLSSPNRLVVITGGEPLSQPLLPLLSLLHHEGMQVQIETSGAVEQALLLVRGNKDDWLKCVTNISVVVSPKTRTLKYSGRVDAWKYVVRAGEIDPGDGLPTESTQVPGRLARIARPNNSAPVYLQPCYDSNHRHYQANVAAAIEACVKHGYRLSLQTHKILGLP